MHGKVLLVISRSCQDHFQIRFDFVSVCSSINELAVGFSVSDLLVCLSIQKYETSIDSLLGLFACLLKHSIGMLYLTKWHSYSDRNHLIIQSMHSISLSFWQLWVIVTINRFLNNILVSVSVCKNTSNYNSGSKCTFGEEFTVSHSVHMRLDSRHSIYI